MNAPAVSLAARSATTNLSTMLEEFRTREASHVDLRFGYPVPNICFSHIHKTGGGTLKRVLGQFYAEHEVLSQTQKKHKKTGQDSGEDVDGEQFLQQGLEDDSEQDSYVKLIRKVSDRVAQGIRLFDTHLDDSVALGDDWTKIVFTRKPKSRLISRLNVVLWDRFLATSPSPDADRRALLNGGLLELIERDDKFSLGLAVRSKNEMAREFLKGTYLKEQHVGSMGKSRFRDHVAYIESLSDEELRQRASQHLTRFAFSGCLENYKLSLSILMWKLGLPAQKTVASVHHGKTPDKRQAHLITDSLSSDQLKRVIGKDQIIDDVLRQRFGEERETFLARLTESGVKVDVADDFVTRCFEKRFGDHIASHADSAVSSYKIRPGDAILGWGLGDYASGRGSQHPAFILEEGSSCGFYVHMQEHVQGFISLLVPARLSRGEREGGISVTMNGVACQASHAVQATNPEISNPLVWLSFNYVCGNQSHAPGMYKFEITNRVKARIYSILGAARGLNDLFSTRAL